MAKKFTFIEYAFIFDDSVWGHIVDFERDLSDFLAAYKYEANLINTVGGQEGRKLFLIRKMDTLDAMTAAQNKPPLPPGRPKTPQGLLRDMARHKPKAAERNFSKGKFLIRKGYLKK